MPSIEFEPRWLGDLCDHLARLIQCGVVSGAVDEGLKRGEAFDGLRVFEQVLYAAGAGEAEGEAQRLAEWGGEVREIGRAHV